MKSIYSYKNFKMSTRRIAMLAVLTLASTATMAQTSFNATGVGAIPDYDGGGGCHSAPSTPLVLTYAASGMTGTLTGIDLSLTATHTWVGDVTATLRAPGGTPSFVLFGRAGSTTAGGVGFASDLGGTYLFTDPSISANNFWTAAAVNPVAAGTYQTSPQGGAGAVNPPAGTAFHAAFSGMTAAQMNGNWTVSVTDGCDGDTGTVTASTLRITGGGVLPPPTTPTNVPTGNAFGFTLMIILLLGVGMLAIRFSNKS